MSIESKFPVNDWQLALEALNDGVWNLNVQTSEVWFSEKWHQTFGYSKEEVKTLEAWLSKLHPGDVADGTDQFERLLRGEIKTYSTTIRYKEPSGDGYKWALSKAIVFDRDQDGNPRRIIGTHTDITSQKKSEQALIESKRRYKALFEYSAAMICTHDINGIITSINPYTLELLGYTEQEIVGKPVTNLIHEKYRHNFALQYMVEIRKKGKASGIMHVVKKNGQLAYLLYHNHLFKQSDDVQYVIGFGQDFTDRIMAEDALRHSMETFSSVFTYSATGIGLVSPEGRWLDANMALCEMTEYSKQELLNMSFQDITHSEDLKADLILVQRMLNKELSTYNLEKRYITKSGKIIWILLTVSLVWKADGSPDFFISQLMDVTRRKQLLDEINNKNTELQATQVSLQKKITQLEELSHIIAHNLRGPAANIKLLADILKSTTEQTSGTADENSMANLMSSEQAIAFIHDASTSLMNTLESVLMIAKISLNKEMPYDDCDIEAIAEDIKNQLHGLLVEKKADFELKLGVKKISYPKIYMESILYNLLNNALKYSDPQKDAKITISTRPEGKHVVLSVGDNGLGINLQMYGHKIFKLNQVFHDNKDSKGVGLFLIKTQIESLGGTIEVKSEEKVGSEFTVTF
ncbi:PAS domain S-box protein [Danxiaibacter flavus]|uniref:histidine kinase n=1 Tax=Danxiaibacter flavus TaxID=3049108 RepID=A0ABV3ZCV1_9BACT|nr:PAS domain S-box protein [Chitinophagaceae bacterium DXS]